MKIDDTKLLGEVTRAFRKRDVSFLSVHNCSVQTNNRSVPVKLLV